MQISIIWLMLAKWIAMVLKWFSDVEPLQNVNLGKQSLASSSLWIVFAKNLTLIAQSRSNRLQLTEQIAILHK